jgi:V8-like Glu-specific endopeptidase
LLRLRVASVMLSAVTVAVAAAGCSSPGTAPASARTPATGTAGTAGTAKGTRTVGAVGYWTKGRLLTASAWRASRIAAGQAAGQAAGPSAGASPNAQTSLKSTRVGALFLRVGSDDHFCTASVVSSPGRDLLITAAHCINGGDGSGYRSDLVFIPDYRDGEAPYGIWTAARLLVAPGWAKSADPALDVGFVVLEPRDGENIEQVLGANTLAFNPGYRNLVRVTGYPQSSGEPITCRNWTTEQSASQLKFSCGGFTGGTSGSPFVTRFDSATGTGHIVGVIGGYQQGGDTASVSYSAYLDAAIKQLYDQAIAG